MSSKKKENATGMGESQRRENTMKRLWLNTIQKIEDEPWDKYVEEADEWLLKFCVVIMIAGAFYFGGVIFKMWMEGKL